MPKSPQSHLPVRPSSGDQVLLRRCTALLFAGAILAVGAPTSTAAAAIASWPSAGQNVADSRSQPLEFTINSGNVSHLAYKWKFTTGGDVSATPTVADGTVYFPDFKGNVYAVNANTGAMIWDDQVPALDGVPGAFSRNSPLLVGDEVVFGDNFSVSQQPGENVGAHVFAVRRSGGHVLWSTQVDSHAAAQVTANPVYANGKIIVGVASNEENDATDPAYSCCTFRGSVLALDASTGQIKWKTYTVPPNSGPCTEPGAPTNPNGPSGCGYSGGAVWDTPAVDPASNTVFVGTGNNYTAPDSAVACQQAAVATNSSDANCTASNDYFDAVVALNLENGQIIWGHKVEGWDAWNVACIFYGPSVTWCPSPQSPDYDFGGAGPNLLLVKGPNGAPRELVGVGQKSGVYWAFDPTNGKIMWNTLVGPGSSLGGIEWGTAYDLHRIYVPLSGYSGDAAPGHPENGSYNLASGGSTDYGSWAALDPQTGKFDWQVPVPAGSAPGTNLALGPASEANGVLYVGSMAPAPTDPNMYALDAATGQILWSFASGGSVNSGPAIANGAVYWGSGYGHLGPFLPFTGNNALYAFTLNGH